MVTSLPSSRQFDKTGGKASGVFRLALQIASLDLWDAILLSSGFPPSFTRPLSSRSTCWCANLSLLLRNSCMSHMQLLTKLLWNVGMLESWNAAGSIAPLRHFEGVFDNGRAGVRLPGCCKDDVGPGFKVKACHMCT